MVSIFFLPFFIVILKFQDGASLVNDTRTWFKLYKLLSDVKKLQRALKNNSLCEHHLNFYIDNLKNSTSWAMKMLDSSSTLSSGFLADAVFSLGKFDECIDVNVPGYFSGQHCLLTFTDLSEESKGYKRTDFEMGVYPNLNTSVQRWSLCVPSSCSSSELQQLMNNLLTENVVKVEASASDVYCQTKSAKPVDATGWAGVIFFGLLAVLIVTSTYFHAINKHPDAKIRLLSAFSLLSNSRSLINISFSKKLLLSLNGIRVLSSLWVLIGHEDLCRRIYHPELILNKDYYRKNMESWFYTFISNRTLSVDTFFVLSGTLVSYTTLQKMKNHEFSGFNIVKYYLHRYARITPVLAVLVIFQVTLLKYVGSGPLWDDYSNSQTETCKEMWWTMLLYIENYFQRNMEGCLPHIWFLCADMQLYIVSPVTLALLVKMPLLCLALLFGAIIMCTVYLFYNAYETKLHITLLIFQNDFYYPTHTRFPTFVIGIVLGYILHETLKKDQDLKRLTVIFGWLASFVCMASALYLYHPLAKKDYVYSSWETSLYFGLFRICWALGVAWVIFACETGHGGLVNSFLSWKWWQPFSRLTYGIYLVHYMLILYKINTTKLPVYLDDITFISDYISHVGLSAIAAVVLYVGIENPVLTLQNGLLTRTQM